MKRALLVLFVVLTGCIKSRSDGKDAGQAQPSLPAAAAAAESAQPASAAFTVTQCESLLVDAERKLAAERAKAPVDCKKDDDCKIVDTSACIPACNDRAIAKKGEAAYAKERDVLRQTSCKLWNDAECPRTTPKPAPTCVAMKAKCNASRCEAVADDAK